MNETARFRRAVLVVATGVFVTGLGWPGLIGRLPFSLFLKNQLHLAPQEVAAFWAVGMLAWYFKPLAGLVCDSFPLFGTRRRWYLVLGSVASSLLWVTFAAVPRQYGAMMVVMAALNLALVVVSTAVGGMLVEEGQKHAATGRLSSMRMGLEGVMSLVAGPAGGWLATKAFGWTVGAGAAIVLSLAPIAFVYVHEPAKARRDLTVWARAREQFKNIVRSRPMWAVTGLIFLVYLAPGFQTPLLYYQQDVLKFDPRMMGMLQFLGGAGVLIGAALYSYFCRKIPLRWSLMVGIILNAGSTMFYLGYHSWTAAVIIDTSAAIIGTLAMVPLYDLAVRATPRGSESFGYALMMSVRTITVVAISDVVGSYLYGHFHLRFEQLVWVNAASTAAVLLFVPFLPVALMARREGQASPGV